MPSYAERLAEFNRVTGRLRRCAPTCDFPDQPHEVGCPEVANLPRVSRNLNGKLSFKMDAHGCVAYCPCQLKPGESQPSIVSMDDYAAYAAVYPRKEGESSGDWKTRIIRDGRRDDSKCNRWTGPQSRPCVLPSGHTGGHLA